MNMTFSFDDLKGRDLCMSRALRDTKRYDIHLYLVRIRNDSDFLCVKWVAERDSARLKVDLSDDDMLQNDPLFAEHETKQNREKTVLVVWPRATAANVVPRAGFTHAVEFLSKRAEESDDVSVLLSAILQFAGMKLEETGQKLNYLLDVVTKMKHLEATKHVLTLRVTDNVGRKGGLFSDEQVLGMHSAVYAFEWPAVRGFVLHICMKSAVSKLHLCAELYNELLLHKTEYDAWYSVAKQTLDSFFKSIHDGNDTLNGKVVTTRDKSVVSVRHILFSLPEMNDERNIFVSYLPSLHPNRLSCVLYTLKEMSTKRMESQELHRNRLALYQKELIKQSMKSLNSKTISTAIRTIDACALLGEESDDVSERLEGLIAAFVPLSIGAERKIGLNACTRLMNLEWPSPVSAKKRPMYVFGRGHP